MQDGPFLRCSSAPIFSPNIPSVLVVIRGEERITPTCFSFSFCPLSFIPRPQHIAAPVVLCGVCDCSSGFCFSLSSSIGVARYQRLLVLSAEAFLLFLSSFPFFLRAVFLSSCSLILSFDIGPFSYLMPLTSARSLVHAPFFLSFSFSVLSFHSIRFLPSFSLNTRHEDPNLLFARHRKGDGRLAEY